MNSVLTRLVHRGDVPCGDCVRSVTGFAQCICPSGLDVLDDAPSTEGRVYSSHPGVETQSHWLRKLMETTCFFLTQIITFVHRLKNESSSVPIFLSALWCYRTVHPMMMMSLSVSLVNVAWKELWYWGKERQGCIMAHPSIILQYCCPFHCALGECDSTAETLRI